MKKLFVITFLALLLISSIGLVSADTLIAGKIYDADYSDTIAGATVEVTCNGNLETTTSLSDGAYAVTYNETDCGYHEPAHILNVYAVKGGLSGSKSGFIHDNAFYDTWDLAIVNVPLIPEFGLFIGALTILSAIGVFFFIRRQ